MPDKTTTSTTISAFGRHPCPKLLSAYSTACKRSSKFAVCENEKTGLAASSLARIGRGLCGALPRKLPGPGHPGCPCVSRPHGNEGVMLGHVKGCGCIAETGRTKSCCLFLMRGICYRHQGLGHSGYIGSSGSVNRLIASNPLGRQTSNRAESGGPGSIRTERYSTEAMACFWGPDKTSALPTQSQQRQDEIEW